MFDQKYFNQMKTWERHSALPVDIIVQQDYEKKKKKSCTTVPKVCMAFVRM